MQKCEKCFLRIDTNTSIKKIFFEKFSSFFGIGSKHFLTFGRKSTERLSELLSTCSETSWRNRLFQFSLFLLRNLIFSKNFLTCVSKFSTKLSKLVPTCSDDHFDEKKRFLKIVFFFEIRAIFFLTFGEKSSAKMAELLSKHSDEHYVVQPTVSLKNSSSLSGFCSKLFLNFRFLFFAKLWKLFSMNWYLHFNKKKSFLKNSQVFSE